MGMRFSKRRIELHALLGLSTFLAAFGLCNARAQTPTPTSAPTQPAPASPSLPIATPQPGPGSTSERPLPDINVLFKQVDAQQKSARKAIREYIYRSEYTEQDLDSHGAVKKTSTEEREFFWVNGVFISRLLARDGKPISGDELKKQNERIDQRIAEAKQRADTVLLVTEKRDLMTIEPKPWEDTEVPMNEIIKPWLPRTAEERFLTTFTVLEKH